MKALPPVSRTSRPAAFTFGLALFVAVVSSFSSAALQAEAPAADRGTVPAHEAESTDPYFVISNGYMELPGEHTTGASYIAITSKNGYTGTVNLTCDRISGVSTATPAVCAMYPDTATLTADKTATPAPQILIFGVGTKLPAGAGGGDSSKLIGVGGAVLACGLLVGIPARRRGWRGMFAAVLLLAAMGSLSACISTPKIVTHGNYYFRVTGVDSTNSALASSGTIKVAVL